MKEVEKASVEKVQNPTLPPRNTNLAQEIQIQNLAKTLPP